MKITSIILFLLGTSALYAGECQLKPNGPILDAYSERPSGQMSCNYVTNVEEVLTGVQKFSESKVQVSLFVQERYDNASFDGGSIIEVPEQLIFQNAYGQEYPSDLMANLATVAHEYGHALLEKKLEDELLKQFPAEAGFITANKELSQLKIQAALHPDSKELKEKVSAKNKDILANKDFIRFARITTAYSELYADVVAVYHYNEKSAILKALYYDEMNDQQYRMVQCRDFNTEFTDRHKVFMTEEHGYFARTRTYIGKNLWPKNMEEKKVMLKKIGDAIVAEVKTLLVKKADLPEFEAANKSLIERLKK